MSDTLSFDDYDAILYELAERVKVYKQEVNAIDDHQTIIFLNRRIYELECIMKAIEDKDPNLHRYEY